MKKLSLINLHDYPASLYSVYWEIGIQSDGRAWFSKILDRGPGGVLEEIEGPSTDEEDARRQSQTWVLERIENYRRRTV